MRVFLIALLLAGVLRWLCRLFDERRIRGAAVPADLVGMRRRSLLSGRYTLSRPHQPG
jgi:hypothetical protein